MYKRNVHICKMTIIGNPDSFTREIIITVTCQFMQRRISPLMR